MNEMTKNGKTPIEWRQFFGTLAVSQDCILCVEKKQKKILTKHTEKTRLVKHGTVQHSDNSVKNQSDPKYKSGSRSVFENGSFCILKSVASIQDFVQDCHRRLGIEPEVTVLNIAGRVYM